MKIIKYSYKFRLDPTEDQKVLLNKHFGSVRWVYNHFLNQRKYEYLQNKKSLTYNQQSAFLTQIKKEEETNWLTEINSQTLQYSLKCLDQAYQGFFNKRTKFPNFKSKRNKNSFTVPQSVTVIKDELHIPKFTDGIKMIMNREVKGLIKHCTISRTPSNKYFVSILTELEFQPCSKTNKSVGIDLGLKDFLVLSDGTKIKNHRFLKHYQRSLKLNQQALDRKVNGSNRYDSQRLKVARLYEKVTNCRMDVIHKTTKMLVDNFDIIYLEDLNIKGMMKRCKPKQDEKGNYIHNGQSAKSGLNKSISDVAWGKFIETLTYKSDWNDKSIVHIDRFFPSSKTCSKCGWINQGLTLRDREWTCPQCGSHHDRDANAAINIQNEGYRLNIKNTSVGTTDNGRGDQIRPVTPGIIDETSKKKKSKKVSEATKSLV